LLFVSAAAAVAQTSVPLSKAAGVISGTVSNGTTGQPVPNVTVDLGIFDATAELESRTATTDARGFFRFTGLSTDPTLIYAAQVEYPAGIPYGSGVLQFAAGRTELDVPIAVYETTADPAGIRVDRVHFIVEFDTGQLLVAELMVFSLDGNRAYIGSGTGTLRVTLPAGAQGLEISDGVLGGRYVPIKDGFVDTLPVPPGQGTRQMLFHYNVPFSGDTLDLVRTILYPAANVNALVADVGVKVSSPRLANQGVRQTPNGNFINLAGQNIAANQPIGLEFSNLGILAGAPAHAVGADRIVLFILAGVAGLGVILLAVWLLRRRKALAQVPVAAGLTDREGLIDALAQLDLAHEAGEIRDTVYRDRRLRLKAQLLNLVRRE
jgi:hypothetical protein